MRPEIKSTTEYTKWNGSKWQPEKRAAATGDLVESIKKTNGNMYVPALIHSDGSIIDGHRRLQACRIAKVPFYYIEVNDSIMGGRDAIKLLNTTSRQWTLLDFISSYAVDNKDYSKLLSILRNRDVPTSVLASWYSIQATDIKGECKLEIDFDDLIHKIDVFKAISGIYSHVATNHIHRALGKLYRLKEFKEDVLLNKIAMIVEHGNLGGNSIQKNHFFLRELCNAYDYKAKTKTHLFHKLIERQIIKD